MTSTKRPGPVFRPTGQPTSQTTVTYDALGRPKITTQTLAGRSGPLTTEVLTYTPLGQPQRVQYPNGLVATMGYNAAGQPTTLAVTPPAGGQPIPVVTGTTYTAAGQLATRSYGSGVQTTWGYSPTTLRLTGLSTLLGTTPLQDFTYGYTGDAVGNITKIEDKHDGTTRTVDYAYDALNRLTTATYSDEVAGAHSFTYDVLGNLRTKAIAEGGTLTLAYNTTQAPLETCGRPMPHAVVQTTTSTGTVTRLSYDCNGNLVAEGTRALTW